MTKIEKIKADTTSTSTPATAGTKKAGRTRRLQKLEKASTVTFMLEPSVRKFVEKQAKAAGLNLTHYMQKLVEGHVIEVGGLSEPLSVRLAAKREVIDRSVALATKLDAAGKFDENFILTVVTEAGKDAAFSKQYDAAVGVGTSADDAAVRRARVSLNQQIGRMIKKSVGARSKRNAQGRIARGQATDTFVATYTLLEKSKA